ncbi:hypothetical protein ACHAP8_010420 [Fusarium lateritium]
MSVVVPAAVSLSPAIRLAKAVSEFGAGLDDRYRPTFKTWQTHSPPSELDVIRLTEEVNRDGSRLHQKSWKPFGTRLYKFLDQVQLLVQPGDILVSGSQNIIASGIATGYLSYFEKVSLLLMRLGHATVIQRDRIQLFPNDPDLEAFTCEYLIVVVEMCKVFIHFEKKNFFIKLTWSASIEKEFEEFEGQLGVWSKVINKKLAYLNEKSQAQANKAISTIQGSISLWSESRKRGAEDWRIQVLHQLSPYQDEFESTWRRERRKGTVEWILKDERYTKWRTAPSSSTLLIHGPLGSGKTVAMANITGKFWPSLSTQAQLDGPGQCAVASFFCQCLNSKTLLPKTLFGSIIHQFLRSLKLPANHPAIRQFRREYTTNDVESMLDYVKTHLPKDYHYYVILDGLDELSITDAEEIVETLASLQFDLSLHICCSARSGSLVRPMVMRKLWSPQSASMSSPEKDKEIVSYIEGELFRRTDAQNLEPATRKQIQDTLVLGAQGMYLWVVLQLNALFPPYGETVACIGDFTCILERLPTGLFQSFESALEKIQDRHYGSRIFEVVAAAMRPLTKNELRSALNIEPGVPFWDISTLPLDPDAMIYRCGGGLLQIDEEENTVHFIHHSALQHILIDDQPGDSTNFIHNNEGDLENVAAARVPIAEEAIRRTQRIRQRKRPQHRHTSYLFTAQQADSTLGYICITCLHLEQHDRRVTRQRKILVNDRVLRAISAATNQDSLLARFMTTVLQYQSTKQPIRKFDMTRVLEDLSAARASVTVSEAQLFFSYAEAHWLDHTSRPSFDPSNEVDFHNLFKKLIDENAPGVLFPWDDDKSPGNIVLWAQTNRHFRLLHDQLCRSKGSSCREVIKTLANTPRHYLSGFICHRERLEDVLCRYIDTDFLDVGGVDTLLFLGALPDERCQEASRRGLKALQVAIEKMSEHRSFEVDIVRLLLHAGADTRGSPDGRPPILLAIDIRWGAGYQILFSYGARMYPVRQFLGHERSDYVLSALDLAMFRGHDADAMIQDLIACGAEIDHYFEEHCWPVSLRTMVNRPADPLTLTSFSGEGEDWVKIQQLESQQHHYFSVQNPGQADTRVLEWLFKAHCDVNIAAVNGMTPLGLAVNLEHDGLVKDLLRAGADPNARYWSDRYDDSHYPLVTAGRQGSTDIVRLLLCHGASIHEDLGNKTILETALEREFMSRTNIDAITRALEGCTKRLEEIISTKPSVLSTITLAAVEAPMNRVILDQHQKANLQDTWADIAEAVKNYPLLFVIPQKLS